MTEIYIVTQGSYSDYHIKACFSNRKYAEDYCANVNNLDNRYTDEAIIEEYDVDDSEVRNLIIRSVWRIDIKFPSGEFSYPEESKVLVDATKRGQADTYVDFATAESYISMDHAKKLAVEARQQWLRENSK